MQERIELSQLGFSFGIENVDADVGRIEAHQVNWSGVDGEKQEIPIKLIPCEAFLPQDLPFNSLYSKARTVS